MLDLSEGIEATLGVKVLKAVIFDRDFRSDEEVKQHLEELQKFASFAYIHECKEIENYLLVPSAIQRAIEKKARETLTRAALTRERCDDVEVELQNVTQAMKSRVNAQFMAKRKHYLRSTNPTLDDATINQTMLESFDTTWQSLEGRLQVVPGKDVLTALNRNLQKNYSVNVTPSAIINAMGRNEIPGGMLSLLSRLDDFRKRPVPEGA